MNLSEKLEKLSENFQKTDWISFKAIFLRNKPKSLQEKYYKFSKNFGEFPRNFLLRVGDSDLNNYPRILVPHLS